MKIGSFDVWYFAKQWTVILWCFYNLQNSELRFVYFFRTRSCDTLIYLYFAKQWVVIFCKTGISDIFIFFKTVSCDILIFWYFAKQWSIILWYFHFYKTASCHTLKFLNFVILQNNELWHSDVFTFCKTVICAILQNN